MSSKSHLGSKSLCVAFFFIEKGPLMPLVMMISPTSSGKCPDDNDDDDENYAVVDDFQT